MDLDIEFIMMLMIVGMAILIPIAGLTARLSLKPIVDAIVRLREPSSQYLPNAPLVEQRFARLEAEIQQLRALLEANAERAEFDRQLYGGTSPDAPLFPAMLPARGTGDDGVRHPEQASHAWHPG